jgi:putative ABC transport system permease protein
MWAVWLRVRAGLRQDWRGPVVLALITGLMGAVVLVALAGARRTDTAVSRFVQYAGPTEGQVAADSRTMDKIAALPSVAYAARGALMLALPVTAGGRMAVAPGQVLTWALIHSPPEAHAIIVAGRRAVSSRASEVMINETAARILKARVGSVIHLRGYRPDQVQQVLNGAVLPPRVVLPGVRVVGIIRMPAGLTDNPDVPTDVTFTGTGSLYATAAFYHRFAASVGSFSGLTFHLKRGAGGLAAFEAEVKRVVGNHAQFQPGSDDSTVAASAQRGTSLQAFALLLFGVIVALAMLVIVAQSIARQAYTASDDFPVLRALGATQGQLFAVALAPGALVAAGGMALAVPIAYGLSVFTPIGLARRAEISPGFSFNAAILLGGAAALALLLAGRAAITALRVMRTGTGRPAGRAGGRGSRIARWIAGRGFPPTAVAGVRLAFEPGRDRTAVPVRSAILAMAVALAAVMALVFGSSLAHVIDDPVVAGWNWDVTVGNPHSGDISAQIEPRLRQDPDVAGFTATAMSGGRLDGRLVPIVGIQSITGDVAPPMLAGRLPRAPNEIALGGRELRALHKGIGDLTMAPGARGPVALHIVGQVVLSPEITNEQVPLGSGGVTTLAGADALSKAPLLRNVFLVQLRRPADQAAIAHLKQQFPGAVLPAVPPPEVRNLRGVNGLPLALALLLTLLATGTVAHTLITSVRRRRRELAILKAVGFVARQVRATVAWQATAIAGSSLILGLPLGIAAGRWAWTLFANQFAIEPVPAISPLVLLAFPAVLVLANAIAAFPAQAAARTQPAIVLRAE